MVANWLKGGDQKIFNLKLSPNFNAFVYAIYDIGALNIGNDVDILLN